MWIKPYSIWICRIPWCPILCSKGSNRKYSYKIQNPTKFLHGTWYPVTIWIFLFADVSWSATGAMGFFSSLNNRSTQRERQGRVQRWIRRGSCPYYRHRIHRASSIIFFHRCTAKRGWNYLELEENPFNNCSGSASAFQFLLSFLGILLIITTQTNPDDTGRADPPPKTHA